MNLTNMKIKFTLAAFGLITFACSNGDSDYDATGVFEATETIVSAEASGKLTTFHLEEGQALKAGARVGTIDSTQLHLTRLQLRENQRAVQAGKPDVRTQIEATKREIENAKVEKRRIENLVQGQVASQKQLDDIDTKIAVLEARLAAQKNSLNVTTSTIDEQSNTIDVQLLSIEDQLAKCVITNPVNGTVLVKYAMANEVAVPGKALYKIADLSTLTLRAYVSGSQLPQFKLGQQVQVQVDADNDSYKAYAGKITWVSDKAEFTPKTIQTKDERANLVYAIKIAVPNDGYLKLGMYGEVKFSPSVSQK
jgi:HlyD family secretion protein